MKNKQLIGSAYWRNLLTRILIVGATIALIVWAMPRDNENNYKIEVGKPWRYADFTAPFNFPIYKSEQVVQRQRDSLLREFEPYYNLDPTVEGRQIQQFTKDYADGIPGIPAECKAVIINQLHQLYGKGIMNTSEYNSLHADTSKTIRIVDGKSVRHETACAEHYKKIHPDHMSFENRMQCLQNLRQIGYAVGCGFMVGSPFQTEKELAQDLKFIEDFKPDMCGIGPFIPHKDTPFAEYASGSADLTCYLLSIIRLIEPDILLPATTALGTVTPNGREQGLLSGANVVMPNLSPVSVRKDYSLYDNKICTGDESAQCRACMDKRIQSIGFNTVVSRGDRNII